MVFNMAGSRPRLVVVVPTARWRRRHRRRHVDEMPVTRTYAGLERTVGDRVYGCRGEVQISEAERRKLKVEC